MGSALAVLLFIFVLIIAAVFVKGFKVDLAGARELSHGAQEIKGTWPYTLLAIPIMIWTLVPLLWTLALSRKSTAALAIADENLLGNSGPSTGRGTTTS